MGKKTGKIYKPVSMALSDYELRIIQDLAARFGISLSSALRIIIREWDNSKYAINQTANQPVDGSIIEVPTISTG